MKRRQTNERSGTQTIERAVTLMRAISARGRRGWQLNELADRCELSTSTAHRMLKCLVREGLVKQRADDRSYILGSLLFELGLSFSERSDLQHVAKNRLTALARRTSGVGFLFFRSGDDFVCGARVGDAELRAPVYPGTRKPLVLSAGGAAMLLDLPQQEASATIDRNLTRLEGVGSARIQSIRSMLDRSFTEGFGVSVGNVVPGVNAFGLSLCDSSGTPFAAITLAGSEQALPLERRVEIRHMLEETARGLRAAPHH